MQNYQQELQREQAYFEEILALVDARLEKKRASGRQGRGGLLTSQKEMWDGAAHSSADFDAAVELSQYQEELALRTASYLTDVEEVQTLERMRDSPYFARVDFRESGEAEAADIYIGRRSLLDESTHAVRIFDWRAPIAGLFYRYERGPAQYEAPGGTIRGDVSLKRQYEIKRGRFEYFFDANVEITDEFLKKLLAKNAPSKMVSIVETIQKDQDAIIRDSQNELLMVQGAAGSGKTSVALHRVAYLMYRGLSSGLSSHQIVILSPSALFSDYISGVLPELGEKNVQTLAFEDLCGRVLGGDLPQMQTKHQLFEELITCADAGEKALLKAGVEFKASQTFIIMLRRLAVRYQRRLVPFCDVLYHRRQLFDRQLLKERLLRRDARIPAAAGLRQIETMILREVREENKSRLEELERFARRYPEHAYEVPAFARMLSIRENRLLLARIRSFTRIDYAALYRRMFHDKNLFYALAKGLTLPENAEEIRRRTDALPAPAPPRYEDALALTFLKAVLAGCDAYGDIRQVVVDEAQDCCPIHFEILNLLFPRAKYTVLGDLHQTIEKEAPSAFYEDVRHILNKKTSTLLTLSKSFRCTRQIIAFSGRFLEGPSGQECFGRDGAPPEIFSAAGRDLLDRQLAAFIRELGAQGYRSVCVLCKSLAAAEELYERMGASAGAALMDGTRPAALSGICIAPIYMAKGLEFDAALVYDADDVHYHTADDKKLLYIAATRALHRLALFYVGRPSRFLAGGGQEDAL